MEDKFKDIDVVKLAIELSDGVSSTYYDLGELLFYIKNSGILSEVDGGIYADNTASWKRFCEDKLSIGYRTAQYWINIYEYFRAYFIEKSDLAAIGWAKAKAMVDITDDPKQLATIIQFAKEHTVQELEAYLQNFKEKNLLEPLNTYKSLKFSFPAYQAEVVADAITLGKEVFGTAKEEEVLASILLDWTQLKASEIHISTVEEVA